MTLRVKIAPQVREDLEGMHSAVVIVGGGQAGLSMSYYLSQRNVEHIL
jgi:putative flavoprotein involved in K+ transport